LKNANKAAKENGTENQRTWI